jgi:hypothetical protein
MFTKTEFKNGDRVEVALSGDINQIVTGKIVGKSFEHVIDMWLVLFDKSLDIPSYPYDVAPVQNTFIRAIGDNRPFLCESGSLVYNELV